MQPIRSAAVKTNSGSTSSVFCFVTLAVVAVSLFCGCNRNSSPERTAGETSETGILSIYVVNYPLKYFAERIGGKHVRVVFPAPPDEDPAFWRPNAETIADYQNADLILLNGASYAKWVKTVSLPDTKLVYTTAAVIDEYIEVEDSVTHSHGPGGDHAHTGTAFTTWLDPQLAIAQADMVRQAFTRLRPQHEDNFQRNYAALEAELNELDRRLREAVEGKSDRPVFFSHPVYQYLQRRYNLNGKAVHWEPEEVPSQEMWDEFAAVHQKHPARWMIWEGEPIQENVKRLEEMGLQSTVYDPCGNVSEDGDFMSVMRENVANLVRALAQ